MTLRLGSLGLAGLLLCLAPLSARAQSPDADAPFNIKAEPLPESQSRLLLENRYRTQADGAVLDPATSRPVTRGDMPFLIQRLESGQRLKALLQLDIILAKSQGEKALSDEERESIRRIARENWHLFSLDTRKDFRSYFSVQELEALNAAPLPQALLQEPDLKDLEAAVETDADKPARKIAPTGAALPAAPAPPPIAAAPSTPTPAPTVTLPAQSADPSSAPAQAVTAQPPALAPVETSSAAAVASPQPPPEAEPAPAKSALPLRPVSGEEFERFLAEAPYGREAKAMLRLISAKAPNFARARVLNDVLSALPQIVLDPDRAGDRLYSRLNADAGQALIALNNGVVLYERRRLFLGSAIMLLPQSAKAYAAAGLTEPDLEALRRNSPPVKVEPGPWGRTSTYADGSQRTLFSVEQEAGLLLAELVRLDARLRGWDASPFAVETVARTAQWLFFDAARQDLSREDSLDAETRRSYRLWLDEPAEYRDHLLHTLAASRGAAADPRQLGLSVAADFDHQAASDCAASDEAAWQRAAAQRVRDGDLCAYEATGLFDKDRIAALRQESGGKPPDALAEAACLPERQAEAGRAAAAVLAEALAAEQRFRQERRAHAWKD